MLATDFAAKALHSSLRKRRAATPDPLAQDAIINLGESTEG